MKISLASDHAGFEQKQRTKAYLESKGYSVIDRGPESDARVDYPDFAALVGKDVAESTSDFGILICGTGIGMSIAANKICHVRAANVVSPNFASLAREHNDANVVCLSARFVDAETNEKIVDAFLTASFAEGRHRDRVAKIEHLESC